MGGGGALAEQKSSGGARAGAEMAHNQPLAHRRVLHGRSSAQTLASALPALTLLPLSRSGLVPPSQTSRCGPRSSATTGGSCMSSSWSVLPPMCRRWDIAGAGNRRGTEGLLRIPLPETVHKGMQGPSCPVNVGVHAEPPWQAALLSCMLKFRDLISLRCPHPLPPMHRRTTCTTASSRCAACLRRACVAPCCVAFCMPEHAWPARRRVSKGMRPAALRWARHARFPLPCEPVGAGDLPVCGALHEQRVQAG